MMKRMQIEINFVVSPLYLRLSIIVLLFVLLLLFTYLSVKQVDRELLFICIIANIITFYHFNKLKFSKYSLSLVPPSTRQFYKLSSINFYLFLNNY